MYKIIIADDEKLIRDGLTNLSVWNELGFEVAATFSNGDEVIEYLEYMPVDVVLTDIRMPRSDGIAVAKYVYDAQLFCKVVFISGYKEFELAVQGMKYGVGEYILKPIETEKIREVFRKLKEVLDAEQTEKTYERQKDFLLKEKFVTELIMGGLDNKEYIRQYMKMMYPDVDSDLCPCILMNMEIKNYQEFIQNTWNHSADEFDNAIANIIKFADEENSFHLVYKNKGKMKIFVIMKRYGATEGENTNMCKEQAESFVKKFWEVFQADVIMDVEFIFQNIYLVSENIEKIIAGGGSIESAELHLWEQKKLIMSNIMMGNINVAQKILQNILKNLPQDEPGFGGRFLVDVFSGISQFLQENNKVLFRKIEPFINYQLILKLTTEEKMCRYCDRIFDKIKECSNEQMDTSHLMKKVETYINENIFADISQADIAEKLFLSTTYLSRLFKNYTGENFQRYVTRKKMDKAVELLHDPQYKVYQIGELLGYKQTRYFSKLFYNYIGYYPSQYRREVLNIGGNGDAGD